MRNPTSFRLRAETLTLAARIAAKLGLSRTAAIEYSIRRAAEAEGIDAKPAPAPTPPPSKPARKRKAAGK
jgi:hypothetical protein